MLTYKLESYQKSDESTGYLIAEYEDDVLVRKYLCASSAVLYKNFNNLKIIFYDGDVVILPLGRTYDASGTLYEDLEPLAQLLSTVFKLGNGSGGGAKPSPSDTLTQEQVDSIVALATRKDKLVTLADISNFS